MRVICVILAGGESRRMGRDKAALPFGGATFLSRLIAEYTPGFPVYVSLAEPGKYPHPGAEELVDLHPGQGPLAGLEAAFVSTQADAVFLTATDLPFGTLELANCLLEQLGDKDACVIRRKDGSVEPTFGVYRRSCLPEIQKSLHENRRAMKSLLDRITVRWVEEEMLSGFDLDHLLWNINTPDAYDAALKTL